MRRPGYLSNQRALKPAALRRKTSRPNPAGFGFFGKGMMLPPPEPGAIDASTGQPYMQDMNCPAGQKVVGQEPCVTVDPNDPCDPGEMEPVCGPDPNYKALKQVTGVRRLLPTGTGHYQEIANGVNVGPMYPANFPPHQPPSNLIGPGFTCSADGTGGIRCEPAQAAAPQPIFIPPPPPPPPPTADPAALQAELFQLESEALKADTMVVAPPMLAPPSAYTGGSVPTSLPTRQTTKEPTTSQKVMEIVQEYQTQREIEQPSGSVITKLPPISQPKATPAPSEEAIPGLLSWLKMSLFGDYPSHGLNGFSTRSYLKLVIPAMLAGALVVYLSQKT